MMGPKRDKLLASAQKSLQKGQYAKAARDYRKLVEMAPDDIRLRQKWAEVCARAGEEDQALESYEQVARYYEKNNLLPRAAAVYKQMLRLRPEDTSLRRRFADLQLKVGLTGDALAQLRHIVQQCQQQGQHTESLRICRRMLELDPDNVGIWLQLLEQLQQQGDTETLAVEVDNAHERFAAQQKWQQLARVYATCLQWQPDNRQWQLQYAIVQGQAGQIAEGLKSLQDLAHKFPQEPQIWQNIAEFARQQEDSSQRRQALEHWAQLCPQTLEPRLELLPHYIAAKQWSEARQLFVEVAAELNGQEGQWQRLEEAAAPLKEAYPEDAQLRDALTRVYERSGAGEKLFALLDDGQWDAMTADSSGDGQGQGQSDAAPAAGVETFQDKDSAQARVGDATYGEIDFASTDGEETEEVEVELELDLNNAYTELDSSATADTGEEAESFDLSDWGSWEEESHAPADTASAAASFAADPQGELEEAEFYAQQGLLEEAHEIYQRLYEVYPQWHALQALGQRLQQEGLSVASSSAADTEAAADAATSQEGARLKGDEADSQRGVATRLDQEDTESYYNLGIAYREMGLYDEAVTEFAKVVGDPQRQMDALLLMALCCRDQQQLQQARDYLQQALNQEGLSSEQKCSLCYEMGQLCEELNEPLNALDYYQNVVEQDPFFRDTAAQVRRLRQQLGLDAEADSSAQQGDGKVSYV